MANLNFQSHYYSLQCCIILICWFGALLLLVLN